MGNEMVKYHIYPRVVPADRETLITAIGLDESSRFYDDCSYYARVVGVDDYDWTEDGSFPTVHPGQEIPCSCQNGVVTFSYCFRGEQQWSIQLYRKENVKHRNPVYDHHADIWQHLINAPLVGINFRIYSLEEDLYTRRPLRGDLHIHTNFTDGDESPEMMAALYRKAGYDFIGITDHLTIEPSLRAREAFQKIPTALRIYPGEEIHNGYKGYFHLVNFDCKESVCEKVLGQRETVEAQIDELEAAISVPEGCQKRELAWRKWMHEAIHAAGGITILTHPYGEIGRAYNMQTKSVLAAVEMGLCDCMEAVSGTSKLSGRRLQATLYQELRTLGHDLPVVGSNDSHSAVRIRDNTFNQAFTLVFARDPDQVTREILEKYTVAVDNLVPEDRQLYGSLRLCKYGWFLLESYYPTHDSLCSDIGSALLRRVYGDQSQDTLIRLLEAELEKYNASFFG